MSNLDCEVILALGRSSIVCSQFMEELALIDVVSIDDLAWSALMTGICHCGRHGKDELIERYEIGID